MNNPSELARVQDELEYWKNNLANGYHSKTTKQYLLDQIHKCEEALGLPLTHYNGGSNSDAR